MCSDPAVCKDANRELFSCFSLSFCTRRLDVRGPLSDHTAAPAARPKSQKGRREPELSGFHVTRPDSCLTRCGMCGLCSAFPAAACPAEPCSRGRTYCYISYLTKMAWQPHLRSAFPHAYQGYACVSCVPGSPRCPHPLTRLCVWRLPPARLLVDPGAPGSAFQSACVFSNALVLFGHLLLVSLPTPTAPTAPTTAPTPGRVHRTPIEDALAPHRVRQRLAVQIWRDYQDHLTARIRFADPDEDDKRRHEEEARVDAEEQELAARRLFNEAYLQRMRRGFAARRHSAWARRGRAGVSGRG